MKRVRTGHPSDVREIGYEREKIGRTQKNDIWSFVR